MVYSCCVLGCRIGYKSNEGFEKISLFQFPDDEAIKAVDKDNNT